MTFTAFFSAIKLGALIGVIAYSAIVTTCFLLILPLIVWSVLVGMAKMFTGNNNVH